VEPAQVPAARAVASAHGVDVQEVPRRGIEPVTTVTLLLVEAAGRAPADRAAQRREHAGAGPLQRVPRADRDQLTLFASKLSKTVAWAIPHGPADGSGNLAFQVGVPTVTERIRADPEVAERFVEIVVAYATTGTVGAAGHHLLPPGYLHFAYSLVTALEYFVLGHEYAHILNGHLDTRPRTHRRPARHGGRGAGVLVAAGA
jgi:hypothetical protein